MREEIGSDFVVGLRICGDELEDEGLSEGDWLAATEALVRDGALDYVSDAFGNVGDFFGSDQLSLQ